jgi:hypothetical protein
LKTLEFRIAKTAPESKEELKTENSFTLEAKKYDVKNWA